MARGNARADIFFDNHDRAAFLENIGRVCQRFDWRVWSGARCPTTTTF
jgi:hypothetical protein